MSKTKNTTQTITTATGLKITDRDTEFLSLLDRVLKTPEDCLWMLSVLVYEFERRGDPQTVKETREKIRNQGAEAIQAAIARGRATMETLSEENRETMAAGIAVLQEILNQDATQEEGSKL